MDIRKNSTTEDDIDLCEIKSHKQALLEEHTHCALCGTELKFQHDVDYLSLTVKEEAHCPSCHVPLRSKEFRLQ